MLRANELINHQPAAYIWILINRIVHWWVLITSCQLNNELIFARSAPSRKKTPSQLRKRDVYILIRKQLAQCWIFSHASLLSYALECNLMQRAAPTLDSAREAIVVPSPVHPEQEKLAVQEINSLLNSEQKILIQKEKWTFQRYVLLYGLKFFI
jgi:hypothetical protein